MDMRLSIKKTLELHGFKNETEFQKHVLREDPAEVPACCSEGCEVEFDGYCPHGRPSIMLVLGLI